MKTDFVTENEGGEEVDPLLGVKVETSWYPAGRGWFRGRRRILGAQLYASNTYHVMSRTCGGVVFFDDTEPSGAR